MTGQEIQETTVAEEYEMDAYTATMIAEGEIEVEDEEHYLAAWQFLVDTELCWGLQGWFGRKARSLIEHGQIKAKA